LLGLALDAWRAWLQHSTRCSPDGRGPHRVPPSGAAAQPSTLHVRGNASRPRPPRLLRLVPRLVPPRPAGRRHRTHPPGALAPALKRLYAAAHPGAAFGAWCVSQPPAGTPSAPGQASPPPLPQGQTKRPSRSAPTTTGSSQPQTAHPNPGHGPCPLPITRPAMPARYGPARYRPARYGVTTLTARGRPARQRSAHS
jgi:hypothetical protein